MMHAIRRGLVLVLAAGAGLGVLAQTPPSKAPWFGLTLPTGPGRSASRRGQRHGHHATAGARAAGRRALPRSRGRSDPERHGRHRRFFEGEPGRGRSRLGSRDRISGGRQNDDVGGAAVQGRRPSERRGSTVQRERSDVVVAIVGSAAARRCQIRSWQPGRGARVCASDQRIADCGGHDHRAARLRRIRQRGRPADDRCQGQGRGSASPARRRARTPNAAAPCRRPRT